MYLIKINTYFCRWNIFMNLLQQLKKEFLLVMVFIWLVFLLWGSINFCSHPKAFLFVCILAHYLLLLTFYFNFREYGELLVRCGLIGEAIKEFEDLELWDNLIHCYRYDVIWNNWTDCLSQCSRLIGSFDMKISLLEKKATAVELIRKRLSERPNDPRLWYVTWLVLLLVLLIRL